MLKDLESCFGVSGLETPVSNLIQSHLETLCNKVWLDSMGNLHGERYGKGPKILLCTHMDEPGVIITKITEEGYLRFDVVGGISPAFLVSKKVFIHGKPGIISLKAIHLTNKKEREIPVKIDQLFIDIGCKTKEEADQIVELGDYGIFDIPYTPLANGFVKGRAIAGRMGCCAVLELLKQTKDVHLHVVFATQRELGNRGIRTAVWNTDAEIAMILDGIPARTCYDTRDSLPESGNGIGVLRYTGSGSVTTQLYSITKQIATKENIPIQPCFSEKKGSEAVLLEEGKEIKMLCLGIPVRYANSVAPIANQNDMNSSIQLMKKVIEEGVNCL